MKRKVYFLCALTLLPALISQSSMNIAKATETKPNCILNFDEGNIKFYNVSVKSKALTICDSVEYRQKSKAFASRDELTVNYNIYMDGVKLKNAKESARTETENYSPLKNLIKYDNKSIYKGNISDNVKNVTIKDIKISCKKNYNTLVKTSKINTPYSIKLGNSNICFKKLYVKNSKTYMKIEYSRLCTFQVGLQKKASNVKFEFTSRTNTNNSYIQNIVVNKDITKLKNLLYVGLSKEVLLKSLPDKSVSIKV